MIGVKNRRVCFILPSFSLPLLPSESECDGTKRRTFVLHRPIGTHGHHEPFNQLDSWANKT
ncbi:hypothetical protein ALIPUT_01931 [Alistipes putredinis DSM 17216]|uniref:Uncharacterized protein n=1 Tax=Alistipes putredinis DSM 17216 TaxID=445970 RepID=B0MXS0_9BACT|nr:hypothetical protein ALIPUT_01931 [Alistipes putredinis DSM 17216]